MYFSYLVNHFSSWILHSTVHLVTVTEKKTCLINTFIILTHINASAVCNPVFTGEFNDFKDSFRLHAAVSVITASKYAGSCNTFTLYLALNLLGLLRNLKLA